MPAGYRQPDGAAPAAARRGSRPARDGGACPARRRVVLAGRRARPHALGMFVVSEVDAAAIRATFEREGELSAAIELRRRFSGITDNAEARACARTIAGWKPPVPTPRPIGTMRKGVVPATE